MAKRAASKEELPAQRHPEAMAGPAPMPFSEAIRFERLRLVGVQEKLWSLAKDVASGKPEDGQAVLECVRELGRIKDGDQYFSRMVETVREGRKLADRAVQQGRREQVRDAAKAEWLEFRKDAEQRIKELNKQIELKRLAFVKAANMVADSSEATRRLCGLIPEHMQEALKAAEDDRLRLANEVASAASQVRDYEGRISEIKRRLDEFEKTHGPARPLDDDEQNFEQEWVTQLRSDLRASLKYAERRLSETTAALNGAVGKQNAVQDRISVLQTQIRDAYL